MPTSIWFWIAFHVGVFIAIAVDLASFKRRHRALFGLERFRERRVPRHVQQPLHALDGERVLRRYGEGRLVAVVP